MSRCPVQLLTRAVCRGQGNVQMRLGQFSRALASYRRAADLAPGVRTCANVTLPGQAVYSVSCFMLHTPRCSRSSQVPLHVPANFNGTVVCPTDAAGHHQRGTHSVLNGM